MILSYALAVLVGIFCFFLLTRLQRRALKFIKKKAEVKSSLKTIVAEQLLESTNAFFIIVFSIFFGSLFVDLGESINPLIGKVAFISFILLVGLWANVAVNHGMDLIGSHYQQKKGMSKAIFSMLRTLGKMAIWVLLVLFILDNLNFQISTLIAGLGIGGIALALAVQNTLQDLFASLSIIVDEPFVIGDLIAIDDYKGYVEYIGIKTTRLRSVNGELIVFSNGDLLHSRLRNYKKMTERRVTLTLEVEYETPLEKIKAIPSLVKELILKVENTRFNRAHLKEFGPYALVFEVVYYVQSPDTMIYMDLQQQINEEILQEFKSHQIEFAYPTSKSINVGFNNKHNKD